MRHLGFDNQTIEFLTNKDNENSKRFYRVILEVEMECEKIRNRLLIIKEEAAQKKYNDFAAREEAYRRDLYQAAYEALKPSEQVSQNGHSAPLSREEKLDNFSRKIKAAEDHIRKAGDIDRHPEIRIAMAAIVNILTLVFTLTIANWVHYSKTDNFLFFYLKIAD